MNAADDEARPLGASGAAQRDRPERLALLGVVANAGLAAVKLLAGLLGQSFALVADAVESLVDIAGSMLIWGALRYGAKPPDENHPFGHGKIEPLAAIAVALLIVAAGVGIAVEAIRQLLQPQDVPAWWTLVVLVVVVAVKETLFRVQRRASKRAHSSAGRADAWHHRSDAITSALAFLGIAASLVGGPEWAWADEGAALLASAVIISNGTMLSREPFAELMDTQAPSVARIAEEEATAVEGVRAVERCEARRSGRGYRIVMHAEVDGAMTVLASHALTGAIKSRVREREPAVDTVLVHIEPHEPATDANSRS